MRSGRNSGSQQRLLTFPPYSEDPVALGLDFTRSTLAEWHLLAPSRRSPDLADDVLLVAAELLANAFTHGQGPCELFLELRPGRLRIEVSDRNPWPPIRQEPRADRPGGHGLAVVEHLATGWGTGTTDDGKTVWADLATDPT